MAVRKSFWVSSDSTVTTMEKKRIGQKTWLDKKEEIQVYISLTQNGELEQISARRKEDWIPQVFDRFQIKYYMRNDEKIARQIENTFKTAVMYLAIFNHAGLKDIYMSLKEFDSEMFPYLEKAIKQAKDEMFSCKD